LNEDVGYGLVFMSRLARQLGVETPTMDAMIHIASVLMERAYASEAIRTPTSLGIGDLSAEALGSL
jgi:opine dehydrogenase